MKSISRFLSIAIALVSIGADAAPVATTVGSNLTAFNPSGAYNNNNWNSLMNNRTAPATADFGNCNALILRCAQPKCASGGCTSMEIATPIVSGCVQSNESCKQYGNDLVQYISAQLVANSTAKANEQAAAAQTAAAQAAAAQSAQQMQEMQAQMQAQMQQMQAQMAQQNAETVSQLQTALEEQKQLNAAAQNTSQSSNTAANTAVTTPSGAGTITAAQDAAVKSGMSTEVLAREQFSNQVLGLVDNADVALKSLKATMDNIFEYAGCDSFGNNCTGPKRVAAFKRRVNDFFDPYNAVLDEIYDALILAQAGGVDITDVYMLLNGSCNQWGEYLCSSALGSYDDPVTNTKMYRWPKYTSEDCVNNVSRAGQNARGGHECVINQVIPPEDDPSCTLINAIKSSDEEAVKRNFLFATQGDYGDNVRVGCASSALENSRLFRNRKKQSSIDIEVLQRIVAQDAPSTVSRNSVLKENENVKYCALTESTFADLQKYVALKTLPAKEICINERKLNANMDRVYLAQENSIIDIARNACMARSGSPAFSEYTYQCFCKKADGTDVSSECDGNKSEEARLAAEEHTCRQYGAKWVNGTCRCNDAEYDEDKERCRSKFNQSIGVSSSGRGNSGVLNEDAQAYSDCLNNGGSMVNGTCTCGGKTFFPSFQECRSGMVFSKNLNNTLNFDTSIQSFFKK